MGKQSLRAGRSILLGPGVLVLIALAFALPTRELFVGLNDSGHRVRQFGVGGGEGYIGPQKLSQNSLICGSCRSEGVKIFIEVSSRPIQTICLICLIWYRRLPMCAVSCAKLVLTSHAFILDLGLPVCCFVHIFPVWPNFFFLGQVLPYFIYSGETLHSKEYRLSQLGGGCPTLSNSLLYWIVFAHPRARWRNWRFPPCPNYSAASHF